jgi:hypothetical protein
MEYVPWKIETKDLLRVVHQHVHQHVHLDQTEIVVARIYRREAAPLRVLGHRDRPAMGVTLEELVQHRSIGINPVCVHESLSQIFQMRSPAKS